MEKIMTNADFSARQPHKSILNVLGNFPDHPLLYTSYCGFGEFEETAQYSNESINEAVCDLIDANLVVERTNPHTGDRAIGLRELVEAHEAPYEDLKERVYQMAKTQGLWPKWRPGQGWRLVDGGGQTVVEGPMDTLTAYLEQDTKRSA
jgi:hypothetical protein